MLFVTQLQAPADVGTISAQHDADCRPAGKGIPCGKRHLEQKLHALITAATQEQGQLLQSATAFADAEQVSAVFATQTCHALPNQLLCCGVLCCWLVGAGQGALHRRPWLGGGAACQVQHKEAGL